MLKTLNLERYGNQFKDAGVTDLKTLSTLNDQDIRDKIGIQLLGPRRKLTSAIEKLRVTRYTIENISVNTFPHIEVDNSLVSNT